MIANLTRALISCVRMHGHRIAVDWESGRPHSLPSLILPTDMTTALRNSPRDNVILPVAVDGPNGIYGCVLFENMIWHFCKSA